MISGKLRQSFESDLAMIAPQAMMFPGLHPLAMMSTLGSHSYPVPPPTRSGPGTAFGMFNAPPYANVPPVLYTPGSTSTGVGHSGSAYTAGLHAVQQAEQTKETVYLYIPNAAVGAVIGTGGSSIREMIQNSGASIKVKIFKIFYSLFYSLFYSKYFIHHSIHHSIQCSIQYFIRYSIEYFIE